MTADEIVRRLAATDPIRSYVGEAPGGVREYKCIYCTGGHWEGARYISVGYHVGQGAHRPHASDCLWKQARVYADAAPDEPGPGKVRSNSPDTSRAARLAVAPRTGTQRERVLRYLLANPATDEAIETALGLSHTPRRLELVEGGWVEDSGQRRPTTRKTNAVVWRATDRARAWAARNP